MTSQRSQLTASNTNKKGHDCVLLVASDADAAARVLGELGSVTEERFEVEWVTELSRGIERLCDGGVGAAVLDLNLPDSKGVETFDKLFQAAPGVPILILSDADTEGEARQAVQRGAQDYLLKEQADGYRLRRTVRTVMDRWAAEAVSRENALATITLDSIGEGVVRTDLCGNVTYLNRFAERMSGWFREEALGRPVADVLRLVDSVSGEVLPNVVVIVTQGDKSAMTTTKCINCTLIRRDGLEFGIENRVAIIHDQDGDTIGAVISFRDVSTARAASLEMSRVAQHDVLTQLPNRTLFDDRLTQAISLAERQNKQLAVLFVDVDQFKRINDTLGHAVGDNLLRSVAGRLTACIRRTDTVSRLGGDEFLILLPQVEHAEDAAITARKILRAMASPHIIDNKSLDINVSIGGSTYPADGQDAESLLSQADVAMYEAKQHGRNSYQSFRKEMTTRLAKRRLLEADLRSALGRDEFLLHYQPKINLQTGQVTGMEALIRWQHPERGMLLPATFVPIAEECGLILRIGQWVLLEACRQAREWSESGLGAVPISVNVSAVEFQSKDFLSGVRAALIATGMEPRNLELELTETVLMQDAESAVITLRDLKAMGVRVAIDDFGTGYSSFTYLLRFPVDTLKVGQSFVQDITSDHDGSTLVGAMISIGKSLKQRVVAVGVETASQLDFLQRHECGEGQGSYFSNPVVAEQAARLFKSGVQEAVVH
ncbi:MAG TPA: EAL domain-containing protein [Candidatus Acidoferrales bacterium]|nr:EAL domain-containing protein [Candidatus Acidoferrales bacterium]